MDNIFVVVRREWVEAIKWLAFVGLVFLFNVVWYSLSSEIELNKKSIDAMRGEREEYLKAHKKTQSNQEIIISNQQEILKLLKK